ncbi:MAG: hypothetical protein HY678_07015 [Chloroflexi bacterium]|nr:hypothetical protein [Chloroflexota bacterium]
MSSARALLDLQEIDKRLAEQRQAYKKLAVELKAQAGLPALRAETEAARMNLAEARVQHNKLLSDAALFRERVSTLETRLYSGNITNMRELTALQEEHNNAKRNLAQAEEAAVPAALAGQEANQQYDSLKVQLAQKEAEWQKRGAQLKESSQKVARDYKIFERQRGNIAKDISPADLAMYDSILKRKEGLAVVRVERGICQCPRRLKLPLRETSKLKDSEALVICSSCGRILLAT